MIFPFCHHRLVSYSRQVGLVALALLVFTWLAGCSTTSGSNPFAPAAKVWLTNQKAAVILPNSVLKTPIEIARQVEGSYGSQVYYMDVMLQADSDSFLLLAFNSFGTKIFEMAYDKAGTRFESSLPVARLKPEYLVCDFQIAFYPADAVASMLRAAGLRLVSTEQEGSNLRRVYDGETLLIEARIGKSESHYRNILRGYEYIFR